MHCSIFHQHSLSEGPHVRKSYLVLPAKKPNKLVQFLSEPYPLQLRREVNLGPEGAKQAPRQSQRMQMMEILADMPIYRLYFPPHLYKPRLVYRIIRYLMGNQPNICCDNGRQEVSWFDQEVPAKVKIVRSKNDFTQSSIAHRGSQREKIFRSDDDEDSMIYSMFGKEKERRNEKARTPQQRAKIFKETPVDERSERSENDRQVEPVSKKKVKKAEEPVYDFQFVVNYRY